MHHLGNIWVNGVAKAVNSYLRDFLEESLDNIATFLCVSPDLAQVIRAFHKEFSLTANYPKGHGKKIRDWVIKNYPKEFFMHAEEDFSDRNSGAGR